MTRFSPASHGWATRAVPEPMLLAGGLLLGTLLRAIQIATSIGTIDASNWLRHVLYVAQFGVLRSYQASTAINHPPFGLELAFWSWRLGGIIGLQFFDAFRILTSAADIVTALALFALGRRIGKEAGLWLALLFFLSPAAIFISAFHCNSDSLMVMFMVLALLATVRQRPILAGILIAAAIGIKIIAFAALPLLLFGLRGRRARLLFLGAAGLVGALVFIPPFVVSGWVAIRNIFGYTGVRGAWGIPMLVRLAGSAVPQLAAWDPGVVLTPLLLAGLVSLWLAEGRRAGEDAIGPERLVHVTAIAFLLVLFLAPGFGLQYLAWLLPWLGFILRRVPALIVHGILSSVLFAAYTSWSGGWPWLWAKATYTEPWVALMALVGWGAIGWALFSALAIYRRPVITLQPERD